MGGTYRVAVVGATGAVGQQMVACLEERHFPVARLVPLASERSLGKNRHLPRQRDLGGGVERGLL